MFYRSILSVGAVCALSLGSAQADVPLGLWQSTPDAFGGVVHVRTKPCGASLCGKVERAKDRRGYDTPSRSVGQRVLWDMVQQSDGSYLGQLWEPSVNRQITARMRVQGTQMLLQDCTQGGCRDYVWTRLR